MERLRSSDATSRPSISWPPSGRASGGEGITRGRGNVTDSAPAAIASRLGESRRRSSPAELLGGTRSRPQNPAAIRSGVDRIRLGDRSISVGQLDAQFRRGGGYGWGGGRGVGFAQPGIGFGLAVGGWNRFWYDSVLPPYHRGWYRGTWGWPRASIGYVPWLYTFGGWGHFPIAHRYGFVQYVNPYLIPRDYVVYDYRQPVIVDWRDGGVESIPPDAIELLDAALEAFYATDYGQALRAVEESLRLNPSDPAAHELRALILFAVGDYGESAATLHALLAAAPGWDWATLRGLYPATEIYTRQLRALEAYRNEHPDSAAARFVLAYHYLVAGHHDAAASQLERVVELEPQDRIARQILESLGGEPLPPPEPLSPPRASSPEEPSSGELSPGASVPPTADEEGPSIELPGVWRSVTDGDGGATISLELTAESGFRWTVNRDDQEGTETILGEYSVNGPMLILEDEQGGVILARIVPLDGDTFRFVPLGAPEGDVGLRFRRAD